MINTWSWYTTHSSEGTFLLTRVYLAGSIWLSYREPGEITGGLFGRNNDNFGTTQGRDYE